MSEVHSNRRQFVRGLARILRRVDGRQEAWACAFCVSVPVLHPGPSASRRLENISTLQPSCTPEKKTSLGKDWHAACLRCEKCNKTLTPGSHAEHDGKPYCHNPCYSAMFGPGGFGRGGAESYKYSK